MLTKTETPKDILNLFATKGIDKDWSFEECKPSDTGKWTHDYHRYPAKFIPQLVEKLIDEYVSGKEALVNDPFYGCGTTVVTAISRGFKASGTDINKIAYLVTKVKSTPIESTYLENKIKNFLGATRKLGDAQESLFGKTIEPLIPEKHLQRIDYWFPKENKVELGKIMRIIQEERDEKVRDFLLVGFSHILKNCSIWLEGSVKPTRDFNKTPSKPYEALRKHLSKMLKGNREFYGIIPSKVRANIGGYLDIKVGDARNQPVQSGTVDLIVSSSPYVTSYEYADLHQLSTIWLDLADDLNQYRKEFIGTSHKEYEDEKPRSQIAQSISEKMKQKSPKMAKEIDAFFLDMQHVFDESFRIMKLGGRCCYVIGDTKLKGVDILNAEVFAESLQNSGFKLDRIIKREIPSKILPQKRDEKTGRFASNDNANAEAYPVEYIVIGLKEGARMRFKDLKELYLKKREQLGADTYKHISELLEEAKSLHHKDWLQRPTPKKDHEQSWRAFKGKALERLVEYIIAEEVEDLGLKVTNGNRLEKSATLSRELGQVKRNLAIDYGQFGLHLPDVDIIIYHPQTYKVLAAISSKVTLRERIAQTGYWKLKLAQDEATKHIRVYFITPDEDGTLTTKKPTKKGRAIVEVDLDGSYVLTEERIEESQKVKLFEHFIEDLKRLLNGGR